MDFLDPKKKRAHQKRLFIGYGLIAIAIGLTTMLLVFAASGYEVNRRTGAITQNGLLFVDSHPDTARIIINGTDKGETSNRYVLQEGDYSVELKASGYRTWQHSFTLEGGHVERFAYPFLFPTSLKTTDTQLYAVTPDVASTSPDRHWIVSHTPDALTTFQVTDISNPKKVTTTNATLSAAVLPVHPNASLQPVEWSTDNRHVLLKYSYDGGQDFIVFDRDTPTASVNLSTAFGRSFTQVTLRDKKADQFYVYDATGGVLQSALLKTKLLTPIASKVLAFWPYQDNTVLYTTDGATADKVSVRVFQDSKTYIVRDLPTSPTYLLNMAEFDNHLYVTVGGSIDGKVYVYKDLLDDLRSSSRIALPDILLQVTGAQNVSFSANARFIAVQGGSKFAVYDAENNRQFRYDTGLVLDGTNQKALWMDGHRLSVSSQGKLSVFEFDGANKQTLNAVTGVYEPMFDRDYTTLFTVSPSVQVKGRTAIVQTVLKLNN